MKKMGIASFTERGRKRAEEVRKIFLGEYQILPYEKDRGESLKEWCLRRWGGGKRWSLWSLRDRGPHHRPLPAG